MSCVFLPGCYLLSFHSAKAGFLRYAKQRGHKIMETFEARCAGARTAAVAGCGAGAFIMFLMLSLLTSHVPLGDFGAYGYQHGWHAVYVEGESIYTASHAVSWHYMTHPSWTAYIVLWFGEALLLVLPFFAVALMMACCPWHFKRMGATCLGTYVLHVYHVNAPWTEWFQRPVLSLITHASFGPANELIVFLWNLIFCILFAQTAGASFHRILVAGCQKSFQLVKRCQGSNDAWAGKYAHPHAPTGP